MKVVRPHRAHPLWFAFILHRVSGLALALFLPVHFLMLATALTGEEAMDGFLHWTDLTVVKIAEFGLVFLLAVHFFGGIRLLAVEFLPWSPRQRSLAAGATALALLVSCTFLLNAA